MMGWHGRRINPVAIDERMPAMERVVGFEEARRDDAPVVRAGNIPRRRHARRIRRRHRHAHGQRKRPPI
jgi:hypothetical protein